MSLQCTLVASLLLCCRVSSLQLNTLKEGMSVVRYDVAITKVERERKPDEPRPDEGRSKSRGVCTGRAGAGG